jgi:hypothetical protein
LALFAHPNLVATFQPFANQIVTLNLQDDRSVAIKFPIKHNVLILLLLNLKLGEFDGICKPYFLVSSKGNVTPILS